MAACIKFGEYNTNFKYIIATCFFNYLTNFLFDGIKEIFIISRIINGNTKDFTRHETIGDIINYLNIIIISFILYKYNEKKSNTNIKIHIIDNNIKNNSSEILLIHNNMKDQIKINISFLNLFLVLSYWVLIDHTTRIIQSLMIFDYCMFELLFISLIISKMLKIEVYSHQKIGIFINSICCLILGILRFIYVEEEEKDNLNAIYGWLIPISIIIYIFIISSTSYIYTKLKFYMDLKFISHTKLLILYGIIGFVFSISACTIETSFKCFKSGVEEYFCKVYSNITNSANNINNAYNYEIGTNNEIYIYKEENGNNKSRYIENFFIYIEDFLKIDSKDKSIEIILAIFGTICYYCSLYFDILVIKYLTPMHFSFCNLIYLLLIEITELIKNIITNSFISKNLFKIAPFISSFIGFLIYLEIVELNFCNLNYNLRKYINKRSIEDVYEDNKDDSIIDNDIFDRNSSSHNNSLEMKI